jgi:hypothetical protein
MLNRRAGGRIGLEVDDCKTGVVLPHLGILLGRRAYARIWPEIISWMKNYC